MLAVLPLAAGFGLALQVGNIDAGLDLARLRVASQARGDEPRAEAEYPPDLAWDAQHSATLGLAWFMNADTDRNVDQLPGAAGFSGADVFADPVASLDIRTDLLARGGDVRFTLGLDLYWVGPVKIADSQRGAPWTISPPDAVEQIELEVFQTGIFALAGLRGLKLSGGQPGSDQALWGVDGGPGIVRLWGDVRYDYAIPGVSRSYTGDFTEWQFAFRLGVHVGGRLATEPTHWVVAQAGFELVFIEPVRARLSDPGGNTVSVTYFGSHMILGVSLRIEVWARPA